MPPRPGILILRETSERLSRCSAAVPGLLQTSTTAPTVWPPFSTILSGLPLRVGVYRTVLPWCIECALVWLTSTGDTIWLNLNPTQEDMAHVYGYRTAAHRSSQHLSSQVPSGIGMLYSSTQRRYHPSTPSSLRWGLHPPSYQLLFLTHTVYILHPGFTFVYFTLHTTPTAVC